MIDNSLLENKNNNVLTKSIHKETYSPNEQSKENINNNINPLHGTKKGFNNHIVLIEDIHKILLYYKDLSNQEKFELCSRERSHMKAYLKEVLKKISKII